MLGFPFLYIRKQGSEGVNKLPKVTQLIGEVTKARIHPSHFRPMLFTLSLRALKTTVVESELERPLADN